MIQFIGYTHPVHCTIRAKIQRLAHRTTFITFFANSRRILEETHRTTIQTATVLLSWGESCICKSVESSVVVTFCAIGSSLATLCALWWTFMT